jgi:hypothetical protein
MFVEETFDERTGVELESGEGVLIGSLYVDYYAVDHLLRHVHLIGSPHTDRGRDSTGGREKKRQ